MFRKLVKATEIEVDGIGYALRFYELKTIRGGQRFSCEVLLDAADRIILDLCGESLAGGRGTTLRVDTIPACRQYQTSIPRYRRHAPEVAG